MAAILGLATPAFAQQGGARVGDVRIEGRESTCWANSYVPCDTAGEASIRIRATATPVRLRVVRMEIAPASHPGQWTRLSDIRILREPPTPRRPPRPRRALRLAAGGTHDLTLMHTPVPMQGDAIYRITLRVNGRTVTFPARHVVWTEHPDPTF